MYTKLLEDNLERAREKLVLCEELLQKYPEDKETIETKLVYWQERVSFNEQELLKEHQKLVQEKATLEAKKKSEKALQSKYGAYYDEHDFRHRMNKKAELDLMEEHERRRYFAEKYEVEIPNRKKPQPSLDEAVEMLDLEMLTPQIAVKLGHGWDEIKQHKHAQLAEEQEQIKYQEFIVLLQDRKTAFAETIKEKPERYAMISGEEVETDSWKEIHAPLHDTVSKINKRLSNYFELYCKDQDYNLYHQEKLNKVMADDDTDGPEYFRKRKAEQTIGDTRIAFLNKKLKDDKKYKLLSDYHSYFNAEDDKWIAQYKEDK